MHSVTHEHEILPVWLKAASSIVLTLLITNALIRKYGRKIGFFKRKIEITHTIKTNNVKNLNIIVKGMTCNHCKATIEENVGKLSGINSVEADINTGRVNLTGEDLNIDQIAEKIESLGYKYKGVIE